jgi:predicted RNase H-like HicB family nuclease
VDSVRVIYHREDEGWWAESPDLEGWSAAGETYEDVRALVIESVPMTLGQAGVEIEHFVPAQPGTARRL